MTHRINSRSDRQCLRTKSTLSSASQWKHLRKSSKVKRATKRGEKSSLKTVKAKQVSVTAYQERSIRCWWMEGHNEKRKAHWTPEQKNLRLKQNPLHIYAHKHTSISAALSWPKKTLRMNFPSRKTNTKAWIYKTCRRDQTALISEHCTGSRLSAKKFRDPQIEIL